MAATPAAAVSRRHVSAAVPPSVPLLVFVMLASLSLPCSGGGGGGPAAASTSSTTPAIVSVMPLGDSITQGLGVNRKRAPRNGTDSYRRPLWHRLRGAAPGVRIEFVGSTRYSHKGEHPHGDFPLRHEGHWGWTLHMVLGLLPAWLEKARPEAVLVLLGSNDVAAGTPAAKVASLTALLVEKLAAAPTTRFVAVSSVLGRRGVSAAALRGANAAVHAAVFSGGAGAGAGAGRRGLAVAYANCSRGFEHEVHTYDGVHPNGLGEEHIAGCFAEALLPFLLDGAARAHP